MAFLFADVQIIPPEMYLSQDCLMSYYIIKQVLMLVKSRQCCIQILIVQPEADYFIEMWLKEVNNILVYNLMYLSNTKNYGNAEGTKMK